MAQKVVERFPLLKGAVGRRKPTAAEVTRLMTYGVTGAGAFLCLVIAFLTARGGMPWGSHLTTDWVLVAIVLGVGPFGFFYNRERKRTAAMDAKFPDFLRDIAESARAGMTLPRALVTASMGNYGALTDEIRAMSAQVEWGVSFSEALQRFAERANTPLINRTVSLVVEAQHAGGNTVDVLTAASEDAREIQQIVEERSSQMQAYSLVIYVAYFVFIAVALVLVTQFIPAFKDAVDAAGGGTQVGGLSFKDFDPQDFNTIFFQAAVVQAIGGGLVGGVLTKGQPAAGITGIIVMITIAWVAFRVFGGGF